MQKRAPKWGRFVQYIHWPGDKGIPVRFTFTFGTMLLAVNLFAHHICLHFEQHK